MIGLATLMGAVLGVYVRNALDTSQTFRHSALVGVRGALMMGIVVGYLFAGDRTPGDPSAWAVGLSTTMLTFCLFTPTAIKAFRGKRAMVRNAAALAAMGLTAGSLGVAVGALVA